MKTVLFMMILTLYLTACKPLEKTDTETTDEPKTASSTYINPDVVSLQQTLDWGDCGHTGWLEGAPDSMQCATLSVPLDNDHPKGKTLSLALTRLPATGDYPIGSLLVISGGPGETSLDAVMTSLDDNEAVADIYQNFDIIGFAPRGIAPSTPSIDCGEVSEDIDAKDFVQACITNSSQELLSHISTQDAVMDIERIRIALGEQKLSLIGYSYGTKVLARYVEAFPSSVRAAVFDGVVDVTEDYFTALAGQEKGFQATFERFAKYCTEFEECPFDDAKHYQKGFWAFLEDIDQKNLLDQDGDPIGGDDVLALIQENLFWREYWDSIIVLMSELQDGQTDIYNELLGTKEVSSDLGLIAINCADGTPSNKSNYLAQSKAVDELSPYDNYRPRDDDYYLDACYYWGQVGTDSTEPPVLSDTLAQILFVAQRHDPTTPYENAKHMAKFFNAPLITREGDGHTLALTGDSLCVDNATVKYLKSPTTSIHSQTCD